MNPSYLSDKHHHLRSKLKIDCMHCSGLCCTALYCTKTDGFPEDKAPGIPCKNLMADFSCNIHDQLSKTKMRGCLGYDCFGAGQAVSEIYGKEMNWRNHPEHADNIFQIYHTVFKLHQMLWYLLDALSVVSEKQLASSIDMLIDENERLTRLSPDDILNLSIDTYREKVNHLIKEVLQSIGIQSNARDRDFFGKDFKKANLERKDFSMSLMIAANLKGCRLHQTSFLGTDLRDANIEDADLRESIFLTQMQLNSAKGNSHTKIPEYLTRPVHW